MKVTDAIKYLLVMRDKVVIPGFGTLFTEYQPAKFIESKGEIMPPTKKIYFKREELTDEALVDFLSRQNNIDKEKSQTLLNEFVKELKAKLNSDKKYKISDLGYFIKTVKGDIKFNSNVDVSLLPESLGLSSEKITVNRPEQHRKQKSTFAWGWVIYPLIILLLAGSGYFFRNQISDFYKNLTSKKHESVQEQTNLPPPEKNEQNKLTEEKPSDIDLLKKEGIHYAFVFIGESYRPYYIISGSYEYSHNANVRVRYLKTRGYDAFLLKHDKKRVALGGYQDIHELITKYKDFVSTSGEDAWVLINREK